VDDEEWGERVHAFVAPYKEGAIDVEELTAYCRKELAGPKRPRAFTVMEALPRNPTGKVLKRQLRDLV
jgi:acyl-CoA synthetase (AMP-forming)/AMP-acid ligase II